jgi:hypothetical protein
MTTRSTFCRSSWYQDPSMASVRALAHSQTENPYLQYSPHWAAWIIGRHYGDGPIKMSRGQSVRFISQCGGYEHVATFDELSALEGR